MRPEYVLFPQKSHTRNTTPSALSALLEQKNPACQKMNKDGGIGARGACPPSFPFPFAYFSSSSPLLPLSRRSGGGLFAGGPLADTAELSLALQFPPPHPTSKREKISQKNKPKPCLFDLPPLSILPLLAFDNPPSLWDKTTAAAGRETRGAAMRAPILYIFPSLS